MNITGEEVKKLQTYLQKKFGNTGLSIRERSQAKDSVEVLLNGEFIGVIYKMTTFPLTSIWRFWISTSRKPPEARHNLPSPCDFQ